MEDKIQKNIIDYFSFFEEFYLTSRNSLKDCQKYAISINKLLVRCKNIKEAVTLETPLERYTGLQNRLCAKLHDNITEEIQFIRSCLSTLEELLEKLCNKHRTLQESCKDIDFGSATILIRGSPYQPPLAKLLKFSNDTLTFACQVCAQIDTSLTVLPFKRLQTTNLVDNFKILPEWQTKIPEIIAYTSFVSENQI